MNEVLAGVLEFVNLVDVLGHRESFYNHNENRG
jgi:hypothetical protein